MHQEQVDALLLAILEGLENPSSNFEAVLKLKPTLSPRIQAGIDEGLQKLVGGHTTQWIRFLALLLPDSSLPPEEHAEKQRLYFRFKDVSPFKEFILYFNIEETTYAETAEQQLEANGFSMTHDDFAFLVMDGRLYPIWVRQLYFPRGVPPRSHPYRLPGSAFNIVV